MQNVIVLFLTMLASGAIGFYLAQQRYGGRSERQLHVLGSEIRRLRRRARTAEYQGERIKAESSRLQKSKQRP